MVMTMVTMALVYFYHAPGTDAVSPHQPCKVDILYEDIFPL